MEKKSLPKKKVKVSPHVRKGKAVVGHVSSRHVKEESPSGELGEGGKFGKEALKQLTGEENQPTTLDGLDENFDINKFALRREDLLAGWDNSIIYGRKDLSDEEVNRFVLQYWGDEDDEIMAVVKDEGPESKVKGRYCQAKAHAVNDFFLILSDDYPDLGTDELIEKANAHVSAKFAEYINNGLSTVREIESLVSSGGEPPELTQEEKLIWNDKWEGWVKRHNSLTLSEVSLTEGKFATKIDDARFVVLDFETTGFDVDKGHRVIELGCEVINSKGTVLNKFTTLIYPGNDALPKTEEASFVHKIREEDLEDAPIFKEVADRFLYMFDNAFVVAQNKRFEEQHLSNEMAYVGVEAEKLPSICTAVWSRQFVADKTPNHKLGTMADYFNIPLGEDAHTTEADVSATSQLLVQQLNFLKSQGFDTLYHDYELGSFAPPKKAFRTKRRPIEKK